MLGVFSPEFAKALGVQGEVSAMYAIPFIYLRVDIWAISLSGMLSQLLKTRRKVVFVAHPYAYRYRALLHRSWTEFADFLCNHLPALCWCIGYWAIFYHHRGGAVRDEYPGDSGDDCAEFRAQRDGSNHGFLCLS